MKRLVENKNLGCRSELVKFIANFSLGFSDIFDRVVLFGSTARSEYSDMSDIDILVVSENITSTKLVCSKRYKDFVIGLYSLSSVDGIEFDIVSIGRNELKSFKVSSLYKQICKDGVVLYDKETDASIQEFNKVLPL